MRLDGPALRAQADVHELLVGQQGLEAGGDAAAEVVPLQAELGVGGSLLGSRRHDSTGGFRFSIRVPFFLISQDITV